MPSPWTPFLPEKIEEKLEAASPVALMPLTSLGVISLTGPDSMKFLQGQTTTDFREVENGRVLPGAVCSLKGRVLFSFIAVPDGENVALVLPRDQIEDALAHLKKYAVFSKTQLNDASDRLALLGVAGPEATSVLRQLGLDIPVAGRMSRSDAGILAARLFEEDRFLLLLPLDHLARYWPQLQVPDSLLAEKAWWAADIRAGFVTVFAAARDRFQPQELNYQALDAVSYNKGCYTGQEIVARLYFRGKLKQRLYRLEGPASNANQVREIYAGDTPVGEVVMSTFAGTDHAAFLAVIKNAAVQAGELTLGENGSPLVVKELPYSLPADKEE